MRSSVGLIAGKFDPPHRGHALLIDVARGQCERLIVFVLDEHHHTVSGELRAHWLREIHPGVEVRVLADAPSFDRTSEESVARSAAHLGSRLVAVLGGIRVDTVFTSEPYGEVLAHSLGAEHASVDRDRALVPSTGTMVRRNPARALAYLEPVVRAYYVPRVCIAGAESTGKSTLAQRLAEHYGTTWVPEYGRSYTLGRTERMGQGSWRSQEFIHIAYEQQRMEDEAARRADPVLICDTDAFSTRIWHEFFMGEYRRDWPDIPSRIALYLLPFPDVPFVADEIREGEHRRFWMHERFVDELAQLGARVVVLEGSYDDRFERSIVAIDALIGE